MPSTVIRSFRYDAERRELAIVFQSGRRYVYEGIPTAVADGMKAAFSKGEFFNREIRDRYPFRREADADEGSGGKAPDRPWRAHGR